MSEIKKDTDLYNAAAGHALQNSCVDCDRASELSFIAGGKWQKEQFKKLLSLVAMAASTLQDEGDTTTANEIIKEIERLESIN